MSKVGGASSDTQRSVGGVHTSLILNNLDPFQTDKTLRLKQPLEVLTTKQLTKDMGSPQGPWALGWLFPKRVPPLTAAMPVGPNPNPSAEEGHAGARERLGATPQREPQISQQQGRAAAAPAALRGQGGVQRRESQPRRAMRGKYSVVPVSRV